ncbi:uncharacterized protein LOC135400367 [Ornithodoros turicata]|uniref:uncharacterized protein LOC135400367 n=1 Tax=Ornithodoros turicata TaxID=34597 RepID=UPI00313944E5
MLRTSGATMPLRVVLKNFLNHFETLEARKKLGDDLFEAEFQSLKELTESLKCDPKYASTEGQKDVNRKKNRYKDILPYNCSRVVLSEYPGVPGSDYINANLIKGASGSKAYIASQGPLPTTVMDFWRMIWECEVQVIVMACNEKESGKYKCERYWPNEGETKQYGNITVELVKWKQVCPDFVLRTLKARCGQEERTICQFHYWTWPDHGVPTTVGPIVDLVRLVRDCQASEALPVLVHCSAGCGRTGTICAIDYVWGLMRVGRLSDAFSLYQIIREMRMQRIAMVQTKEQYVLVHRVVAALFEQQLRIIDSHTYENLDEDGEPLLGKGIPTNSEKIYENIDDLAFEKNDSCDEAENDEKHDEEKEVPPAVNEPGSLANVSKAEDSAPGNWTVQPDEMHSAHIDRASRSSSWSPEPISNETSSSLMSLSDPRMSSRSSMITDDEDSQSCKEDLAKATRNKAVSSKPKADGESNRPERLSLNRALSLSTTNIASTLCMSTNQDDELSKKVVGKATVIRRPSIARLKALFERSLSTDSDEPGGDARRKRPIFRSYSQRVTPNQPAVARTPTEKPATKQKPVVAERKTLGPSARKAKEFRELEKNQKSSCHGSSKATVSGSTASTSQKHEWYALAGAPPAEPMGTRSLYKSLSSSNIASATHVKCSAPSQGSSSAQARDDTCVSHATDLQPEVPPTLPTKKRTAQAVYASLTSQAIDSRRKSQTLPAPPRVLDDGMTVVPPKTTIYDFLPGSNGRVDAPPRLPPKKVRPSQGLVPHVPLSALNNTYVNVSDVLMARRELLARLREGHRRFNEQYTNVAAEAKENRERTVDQHRGSSSRDLVSRKLFEEHKVTVPKYEQIWNGSQLQAPQASKDRSNMEQCSASNAARCKTVITASEREKSATLPSAFRSSECSVHHPTPTFSANWQGNPTSASDLDTSDICTTTDEQTCSGTEYDTIFVESSDTGTDVQHDDDFWHTNDHFSNTAPLSNSMLQAQKHTAPCRMEDKMSHPPCIPDTDVKQPAATNSVLTRPFLHGSVKMHTSAPQASPYEHIYPTSPRRPTPHSPSENLPCQPPPKPPRTFEHGKFDGGRLIVSVVSPKKHSADQGRSQQHCASSSASSSGQGNGVQQHDYENIYSEWTVPFTSKEVERQVRPSKKIVKHHSEYRPHGSKPHLEATSERVPATDAGKSLHHSLSDVSIYEVLRASHQQQQHPEAVGSADPQYAVVVKPKKQLSVAVCKEQKSSEGGSRPAAPPRVRRHVERLEGRGTGPDTSDASACKGNGKDTNALAAHVKTSVSSTAGKKASGKDGSSGSDSGSISGTLSKAFGKLNLFSKINSSSSTTSDESKKMASPPKFVVKKPAIPHKPPTVITLAAARFPSPSILKPHPLNVHTSQIPSQQASPPNTEHWTQV